MDAPRRFGQKISGNARRGPNISPVQRASIIAKRQMGASIKELMAEFGRSESAIKYTIRTYTTSTTMEEKPRSGRPQILSLHSKKIIYRLVRKNPKIEYKDLREAAVIVGADGTPSKPPCHKTLYRALKEQGRSKFRCKRRPKLNRGHALKRLQFCREYRHFQWGRRIFKFSDECSIQKGSGHNQEWCFRFAWEKWKRDMITPIGTGRKPAQMVWASIWLDERGRPQRSNLVIMERDLDAKNNGYSTKSYIKALTTGLLPHWRRSHVFMQDNARIHTSAAARAWLRDHRITPINWPAYSPDLNPLEHLWWHLKRRMHVFYPQYNNHMRAQEEWDGFCEALKECWRAIPGKLIKKLIMSMPRRMAAVRAVRGWQTKY